MGKRRGGKRLPQAREIRSPSTGSLTSIRRRRQGNLATEGVGGENAVRETRSQRRAMSQLTSSNQGSVVGDIRPGSASNGGRDAMGAANAGMAGNDGLVQQEATGEFNVVNVPDRRGNVSFTNVSTAAGLFHTAYTHTIVDSI